MKKNNKYLDVTVPIRDGMTVYPGNPPVEIEELVSSSTSSTISKITFGSHTGTHVDAPKHVYIDGAGVETFPLEIFIGPCRVIDCTSEKFSIGREVLEAHAIQNGERILLKTQNSERILEEFFPDFIFLSPEGAQYLADQDVLLVGIDYYSIKQKGSKDNRPHTLLLEKSIPILEGLDLSKVIPGEYHLISLPLRLDGLDGSPMRAVLSREF